MTGCEETTKLREAFAAYTSPAAEDCPPPERIWEAIRGELSPGEVRDVVDHTADCPACAADWRLAHALERQSGEKQSEVADAPVRRLRFRALKPWLAAAAAGIMIVVGVRWSEQWMSPQEAAVRGDEPMAIRSLTAEVSRQRCLLRWTGPEGAMYDIEIQAGEDPQVIAREKDLKDPQYLIPRTALENLPASTKLYWQVEVIPPRGRRYSSSTFVSVLLD